MSGVEILTVPSKLNWELALISLVELLRGRSSIPNSDSTLMLMLPPFPCWASAIISLLPSTKATINLESIFTLPPLPRSKALAETKLLSCMIISSATCKFIFAPSPVGD